MIDPSFLRKKNYKWRFPVLAVLFHIAVIGALFLLEIHFRREMIKEELKKIFEVKQITQEELDKLISRRRTIETNWLDPKDSQEVKDQKAFLGEKTQRVKKETIAIGKNRSGQESPMQQPQKPPPGKSKLSKDKGFGAPVTNEDRSQRNKGPSYNIINMDPSLSVSPKTYLNTDTFVYASFSNRLREVIGVPWSERTSRLFQKNKNDLAIGIYVTTAKYVVAKDGKIIKVDVTRASGIAELDKAAVDSIWGAKVIQNPPALLLRSPSMEAWSFRFISM